MTAGNAILVAVASGAVLAAVAVAAVQGSGSPSSGHQPIDFFHHIHAGERRIACGYCHHTAETAAYAGMPSTQLCMSCHRVVLTESPEIWKLRSYWELGQPVAWNRVNQLPAHVAFSHQAHTAVARIGCATCHGPVETMDRLTQTAPLTMGWCLDCHRKQHASTECWSCHR